ncbi:MAG: 2-oxoacid:acceptor oxidoreductase family protein, partial [Promethearchaeota archaeon]
MDKDFNIVLVGTGGQGVISASNILGWAALKMDGDNKVRTAETHGMAQRGGTVIVHLRFGRYVESPLVKIRNADVILSLELVEAVRYLNYLKKDGILLVNDDIIIPPILFQGQHMIVDPEVCVGCGNCRINCLVNTYYQDPKC